MPFAGQLILPDGGDLHGRQPHPAAPAEGREQRLGQPVHRPIRGAILLIHMPAICLLISSLFTLQGAAGMGPRRAGQP